MGLRFFAAGIISLLFVLGGGPSPSQVLANGKEAPMITKEELVSMMANPDVMILDVREAESWKSSKMKIKGAVREDPLQVKTWSQNYPKDKTLVLYCA